MGTTHLPLHLSSEVSISPPMVGGLHLLYRVKVHPRFFLFATDLLLFYFIVIFIFQLFPLLSYSYCHRWAQEVLWSVLVIHPPFLELSTKILQQLWFHWSESSTDLLFLSCTYFPKLIFASIACRWAASKASFISFLYFLL